MSAATGSSQYRAGELAVDRFIHMTGTLAGVVGAAILVGIAAGVATRRTFSASLVYSVCLVAMLGSSAAYNLASSAARRGFLHQLDHAAIFLMIIAIYTPFTTCRLHGVWAIGMTAAVWTGAVTVDRGCHCRAWRGGLSLARRGAVSTPGCSPLSAEQATARSEAV